MIINLLNRLTNLLPLILKYIHMHIYINKRHTVPVINIFSSFRNLNAGFGYNKCKGKM